MGTEKRSRLTLGELLLTRTIVVVPAFPLLPVFAQARQCARQAVCLAKIRTIAAGGGG